MNPLYLEVAVVVLGIILLIRWPAKVPVGDFDTTGAQVKSAEDEGASRSS